MAEELEDQGLVPIFVAHGFLPVGESGNQVYGTCPFCGKDKMYVNPESGQYDCKRCGVTGNAVTFLQQVVEFYADLAEDVHWNRLESMRSLPREAMESSGLVWDGERWLLPVRTVRGTVQDIRCWKPSKKAKFLSTKGCKVGLYGAESLEEKALKRLPVYLCEGEWDTMAFRYMLQEEELEGVVVGVPGAETWKKDWTEWLAGRDVTLLYDNDEPGKSGVERVVKSLSGVAKTLQVLIWPDGLPEKYDIRNAFSHPVSASEIIELCVPANQRERTVTSDSSEEVARPEVVPLSFKEAMAIYTKWLHMTPEMIDALRIMFSVVVSNRLPGDPLWVYIVAPPGASKTELLMTLQFSPEVIIRSTLTPHSMISGFIAPGGRDPSLLPMLDGRTFVLKDYTEVFALPKISRDEIYAILRGAYDGVVEKNFGNGVYRRYELHFSMLAGCTQQIYADKQSNLGERFLKFRMSQSFQGRMDNVVRAALKNVSGEDNMRHDLAMAGAGYVASRKVRSVDVPDWFVDRLVSLAQLLSMLRGEVERDTRSERLLYMPEREVGTRVAKQLKKLAMALAILEDTDDTVDWDDIWRIVRRVALDSSIGFNRTILGTLLERGEPLTGADLAESTGIPVTTIRQQLEDLELLEVITREKRPSGAAGRPTLFWKPSGLFNDFVQEAGIGQNLKFEQAPRKVKRIKVKKG